MRPVPAVTGIAPGEDGVEAPGTFSVVLQRPLQDEHPETRRVKENQREQAALTIAAAKRTSPIERVLNDMAGGRHLSTLAFSEAGSRSHFWAPVSRAVSVNGSGVALSARKSFVTGAGHVQSYVASALAPQ